MTPRRLLARVLVLSVFVAAALAGTAACSPTMAPVYQVSGVRLTPYSEPPLSVAEVREVVLRGLAQKRWNVQREEPSAIVASVTAGGHEATVRIDYNSAGYSISYVDSSSGLKYDGQNIHRRYNHWVRLLDDAIRGEFSKLQNERAHRTPAPPAPPPVAPDATPESSREAPPPEPSPSPTPSLAPSAPAPAQ